MAARSRFNERQSRPAQGGLNHRHHERPSGSGANFSAFDARAAVACRSISALISPLPPCCSRCERPIPRRDRRRVGDRLGRHLGPWLQVPKHQMRVITDDLPRIELVLRVERILDFAEYLDQLAVLLAQKLGARQTAAAALRDRSARLDDDVVNAGGQRFQLGPIAGIGQIEKRPQSQPAVAGVSVDRPRDVLLLENMLAIAARPRPAGPGEPRRHR